MNSIKKLRKKSNRETAAEENARLEYASLYVDDAGPTEEEKKLLIEMTDIHEYINKKLVKLKKEKPEIFTDEK